SSHLSTPTVMVCHSYAGIQEIKLQQGLLPLPNTLDPPQSANHTEPPPPGDAAASRRLHFTLRH
ncbi:hypothetical protein JOQ06_008292, partial [Pogonophryne albipinna]